MFGWKSKSSEPTLDVLGRDPGWYAAMDGDQRTLRRRLDKGLDVDHAGRDRMTMLSVAAHYGKTEVVRLLLNRGANSSLSDKHGNGPLWHATRSACADPVSPDFDLSIIAMLLAAGADPEQRNRVGKTSPGWADGNDARRQAVQTVFREFGYTGPFAL